MKISSKSQSHSITRSQFWSLVRYCGCLKKKFFKNGKGCNLKLTRKFFHLKEIYLFDFQAYQSYEKLYKR